MRHVGQSRSSVPRPSFGEQLAMGLCLHDVGAGRVYNLREHPTLGATDAIWF
jgi:hypothetical protein